MPRGIRRKFDEDSTDSDERDISVGISDKEPEDSTQDSAEVAGTGETEPETEPGEQYREEKGDKKDAGTKKKAFKGDVDDNCLADTFSKFI